MLACSAVVLLIAAAASLRTSAVFARHRAESAADFAALAAAGQIGLAADGCGLARLIAAANGGQLVRCRIALDDDARSGTVDVTIILSVHLPGLGAQQITASARAGRLPTGRRSG